MRYSRAVDQSVRGIPDPVRAARKGTRRWWVTSAAFAVLGLVGALAAAFGAVQQRLGWAGAVAAALGSATATVVGILANGAASRSPPTSVGPDPVGLTADDLGLLYVREGRLPTVREVTAAQLGVKAVVHSPGERGMPRYVRRDVDDALESAADDGGFVLLHGPAAAGKTRTAYELLRRYPDRRVYVPDPDRPDVFRRLMKLGERPRDAIIWLDDIDRMLVPGGLDHTTLAWLCPSSERSIVVIGTLRDHAWTSPEGVLQRFGTGVLNAATAFPVSRSLSAAERRRAQSGPGDTRVAAALRTADGGFGEHLAAGPQLLDRWQRGAGATGAARIGSAIVAAAVDFRRAGYLWPVPHDTLAAVYRHYLPASLRWHPDAGAFDDGLRWARELVSDASSCLAVFPGDRYLAHDYLVDRTQAGDGPLGGTTAAVQAWEALLNTADDDERYQVGVAAYQAAHVALARVAFERSAGAGGAAARYAMFARGVIAQESGDGPDAERWWRRAADAGHAGAMLCLSVVHAARGDTHGAATWYASVTHATTAFLVYRLDRGPARDAEAAAAAEDAGVSSDHAGTAAWWQRFGGPDVAAGLYTVGAALSSRGDVANAEHWWRQAAALGNVPVLTDLAVAARRRNDPRDATRWYQAALEHNEDPVTMRVLAGVYRELRDRSAAQRWYRSAAALGDFEALCEIVDLYVAERQAACAVHWYCRAMNAGVYPVDDPLLELLNAEPDALADAAVLSEVAAIGLKRYRQGLAAEGWLRLAAAAGDAGAQCNLAVLRSASGDLREAEELLVRAAATAHQDVLCNLADLYTVQGRPDKAAQWYLSAAEAGSTDAMLRLALHCADDPAASTAWLERARSGGTSEADLEFTVAGVSAATGDMRKAQQAYRRGAELGDGRAMLALCTLLADTDQHHEAIHWLHEAEFQYDEGSRIAASARLVELCAAHDHQGRYEDRSRMSRRSHPLGLRTVG